MTRLAPPRPPLARADAPAARAAAAEAEAEGYAASASLDHVTQARAAIGRGEFGHAVALCDAYLAETPNDVEALYTKAVGLRLARDHASALTVVRKLIGRAPDYAKAYQERGHLLMAGGDTAGAMQAYTAAVARNAALGASWGMLARLSAEAGDERAARHAAQQHAYYTSLPPELQTVASYIAEQRWLKAERLCRSYLQQHGHHVEAMRMLAEIGAHFSALDEAEFLLESALVLAPSHQGARFDYVETLSKRQKFEAALAAARTLRAQAPDAPQVEMLYANQELQAGNFDAALAVYDTLAARVPGNPTIHLTRGHALKTVGRQADAIAAYRQAYAARPEFGDAYWSLANLKTYRFDDDECAAMRAHEAAATTPLPDRYHLCFALGKALEDRGDYADAFTYYERGNRLKRDELKYDWRRLHAEMALQIAHCTPDLFAQSGGAAAPDPIFILGLPRAGSTLLEQILSSHSQVEGTMELPNILALAHRLDGRRRVDEEPRYPANLHALTPAERTAMGEAFLRDTRIHRKQGTPFFIDKMPNNFRHIGLIRLILPNAKIIDARRGAMGCCFSNFKQLFAEGQEFTYGLEEIGHYYADYVRLMDHWDAVLPGYVLRVQYEDVVTDLEGQVSRLLDFCGLPFEQGCLQFHQTSRAVRTASSEQVRQPIFRSGLDQWENFSPYLDPLRAVLGPALCDERAAD